MERINMDTMEVGSPEYMASMLINLCQNELTDIEEGEFEAWLKWNMRQEEITLGKQKLKVPEAEKKATLHFIAFWYYKNKEQ